MSLVPKHTIDDVRAFCTACEHVDFLEDFDPNGERWICPNCAETMLSIDELDRGQKSAIKLFIWLKEVNDAGLGGPSPGGASEELKCSRSMVDKLVGMGILERCEYEDDGHKIVMISSRSIDRAKKAKRKEGKWTDAPSVPNEEI